MLENCRKDFAQTVRDIDIVSLRLGHFPKPSRGLDAIEGTAQILCPLAAVSSYEIYVLFLNRNERRSLCQKYLNRRLTSGTISAANPSQILLTVFLQ